MIEKPMDGATGEVVRSSMSILLLIKNLKTL
jgi:hypothetical protein